MYPTKSTSANDVPYRPFLDLRPAFLETSFTSLGASLAVSAAADEVDSDAYRAALKPRSVRSNADGRWDQREAGTERVRRLALQAIETEVDAIRLDAGCAANCLLGE